MAHGRWYPSQLLMPDGRTFIMGGLDETGYGRQERDLELFTPAARARRHGHDLAPRPRGALGRPDMPPIGDYYPHMFWMPSGRGLVAGPYTNDSWWFDAPGNPATFGPAVDDIGNCGRTPRVGDGRAGARRPGGSHEVVQLGGSDTARGRARRAVSERGSSSTSAAPRSGRGTGPGRHVRAQRAAQPRQHRAAARRRDGRRSAAAGSVKALGAQRRRPASGPRTRQMQIELWDPATRTWRLGPAQREFRAYHSTAVLLPDGRVVSAGDDYNGRFGDDRDFTQDSAEIYEPPYLFDGDALAPRPAIAAAPAAILRRTGVRRRDRRRASRPPSRRC